ncbi:HNH endonuclease [Lysinibacillus capsici]|uniref:HNH endonuclease n=1 Tax=Lysinibacillus capsici TaxID=2115968 RepID=UPI001C1191E8|nr:HNH endonuclease [Lysinibacillus capsici]MBU5250529.1 HNH endonuclease [Lysinibacillus capsici]
MSREIKYFPIPGHEGYYVDVKGNVYSRWVNKGRHGVILENNYKKLKPKVNGRSGHYSISLGRKYQKLVHRLVYESIVGKIPEGMVVRHLNDKPSDNRVENLAIGTQKDNVQDCLRNGHHKAIKKIPKDEYENILRLKETHTWQEIAKQYQVNEKTVRNHIHIYRKRGKETV